jgi:excisionase family DNA binding protein
VNNNVAHQRHTHVTNLGAETRKFGHSTLPQLMTPEETANYLGISAYTVRKRLGTGEILGRKHGSKWLIRVVDLEAYVEPNNRYPSISVSAT